LIRIKIEDDFAAGPDELVRKVVDADQEGPALPLYSARAD
jgi:hypothetical protein